jgi:sarcosine oxidase subunit alpha
MMTVDSVPNVRVCVCPVRDGMKIQSQNAWPSLENDFYSVLDKLSFLIPAGFQYRRFIRPRFMWSLYEKFIRRIAGLGKLPSDEVSHDSKRLEERSADVVVIGGGPAGMSAALQAGKLGADTLLINDAAKLGGRLRLQTRRYDATAWWGGKRGFEICEDFSIELSKLDNVTVFLNSTAFGYYAEDVLAIESPESFLAVRPRKLVVATGCYDMPSVFFNNDLPGIFLPIGLQRLMNEYGIQPGLEGVVVTNNDFGYELARNMVDAGVNVKAVADERKTMGAEGPANVQVLAESTLVEAMGGRSLSGVRIKTSDGRSHSISCDWLCVASGTYPSNELLFQLGCEMTYSAEAGGYVPVRDSNMLVKENCFAIGGAAGTGSLHDAVLEGTVAGAAACLSLGIRRDEASSVIQTSLSQISENSNTK